MDEGVTLAKERLGNLDILVKGIRIINTLVECRVVVPSQDVSLDKGIIYKDLVNDNRILSIAILLGTMMDIELVSNDIALRVSAEVKGIKASPLKYNRGELPSTYIHRVELGKPLRFKGSFLDLELDLPLFSNLEIVSEGYTRLAYKGTKGIVLLDESKLRKLVVNPKNKEQLFFLNMLMDDDLPVVVCAGVPGSGKNLLSLCAAVHQLKKYRSIYYSRNTVTAGDQFSQLGFLKGDESQKMGVFTYPLYDSIKTYMELESVRALDKGQAFNIRPVGTFMEEHEIGIINMNQMRGSSIEGFIILDEFQNTTASMNKLMLSRVKDNSKVVILGDINQIDHPYLSRYDNALAIMLRLSEKESLVGAIMLEKVLRGRVADLAERCL
jgi:PhoH-like ATPase